LFLQQSEKNVLFSEGWGDAGPCAALALDEGEEMKHLAPHVLAAVLVGMASATIAYGQEKLTEKHLIGEWILPENGSVIRVHRCGDSFCGADIKVTPRLWNNSPGPRPPGILIPSKLKKTGPTAWHGELRNIRDGDTYEGTLKLLDKNHLALSRCIIGSAFCETVTFHRVEPPRSPDPEKWEQRGASAKQLKAKPLTKPKSRVAVRQPTSADFAAFLAERGIPRGRAATAQEKQALFREFMDWWSKR
jgi:uncharacterized protein (DUF2147 family)